MTAAMRIALLGLACLALAAASLAAGSQWIDPHALLRALLGTGAAADTLIVWSIRLPRLVLAALAGASLALAGTVLQGITRNGLADPGILGLTAGAGLGAVSYTHLTLPTKA
jgi:iron complex transport system permease protein